MSGPADAPAPAQHGHRRGVDLRRRWRAVRDRRVPVLAFTAAITSLAALYAFQVVPEYRATATLLLEEPWADVGAVAGAGEAPDARDAGIDGGERYRTRLELLRSRQLAGRVVEALGAEAVPGDVPVAGAPDSPMARARDAVERMAAGWPYLEPAPVAGDAAAAGIRAAAGAGPEAAVDALLERLHVSPVGRTRLVGIGFESPDPERAVRVADAFAEAYVALDGESREARDAGTASWVERWTGTLERGLVEAERRLAEFRATNPSTGAEDAGRVNEQQLFLLERDLERARETFAELDAELAGSSDQVPDGTRERRDLAARRIAAIETLFETTEAELRELDARRLELGVLEREVETARARYAAFAARSGESVAAGGPPPPGARIVDRAALPDEPVGPGPLPIIALAALLSLLLASLVAVLHEAMDDSIGSDEDVERGLGLTLLGALPSTRGRGRSARGTARRDPVAVTAPDGAMREAIDRASAVVRLGDGARRRTVLLVASTASGEGRSTAALGLARSLADGERVLLIDADVRRPVLGALAGCAPDAPGLTDVLVGATRTGAAIRREAFGDALDLLPCGPVPERPLDLLSSPRLVRLLELLPRHYDRIVVDCGPVRADADALALGRLAGAVVFVVRSGDTPARLARRALARLRRAGAPVAGALVTGVDATELGAYGGERRDRDAGHRDDGEGAASAPGVRLALTHHERRELYRDDDFELGMGGEDLTANLAADATADMTADLAADATENLGAPMTGRPVAAGGRSAYDPLAYDPDVDAGYDDRDVNALVARVMAESAGRRVGPDPGRGHESSGASGSVRDAGRRSEPVRTAARRHANGRSAQRDDLDVP